MMRKEGARRWALARRWVEGRPEESPTSAGARGWTSGQHTTDDVETQFENATPVTAVATTLLTQPPVDAEAPLERTRSAMVSDAAPDTLKRREAPPASILGHAGKPPVAVAEQV